MKRIHILSESATVGERLRGILYQAGFAETLLTDLSGISETLPDSIAVIYAKSHISGVIQSAAACGNPVILLLNPDCYAMYLDRARHAGITLLLMPVAPFALLDAVQNAAIF